MRSIFLIRKSTLLVLFLLFAKSFVSQNDSSFRIGVAYAQTVPAAYNFPSPSTSPSVDFFWKQHEFSLGPDIYYFYDRYIYKIWGEHILYAYHFKRPGKKFNLSLNTDIQFVRFQSGQLWDFPYSYVPSLVNNGNAIYKNKVFSQSFGLNLNFRLFKIARWYFTAGECYVISWGSVNPNYIPYSPLYKPMKPQTEVKLVLFFKTGFSCNLYSFRSRSITKK